MNQPWFPLIYCGWGISVSHSWGFLGAKSGLGRGWGSVCAEVEGLAEGLAVNVLADALQVGIEAVLVLAVYDVEEFFEFIADFGNLSAGAGVEEDFAQEAVVLAQYAAGDGHVALEGCAWGILVLHHGGEDEGGDEGDAEGIGHGFVVLFESVFADVEAQPLVEVLEEDAAHVVAFGNDDGVLRTECAEVGEGGTKHGVRGNVAAATRLVEFLHARLDRGDVAEDAVVGQEGKNLAKDVEGVFQRDGVDDQFGAEIAYLFQRGESEGVVHESQALGLNVIDGRFVLEAEEVHEEGSHLACT